MWQLSETDRRHDRGAAALGIPCVGGNVSLYNESSRQRHRPDAGHRRARHGRSARPSPARACAWSTAAASCSSAPTDPELSGSEWAATQGHRGRGTLPRSTWTRSRSRPRCPRARRRPDWCSAPTTSSRAASPSRWPRWPSRSGVGFTAARLPDHADLFAESAGRAVLCVDPEQLRVVLDVLEAHGRGALPHRGRRRRPHDGQGSVRPGRRRAPFAAGATASLTRSGPAPPRGDGRSVRTEPVRQPAPRQPSHRGDRLVPSPGRPVDRSWSGSRTSPPAPQPSAEAEQLDDLAALGLTHDGPVVRQSERTDVVRRGPRPPRDAGMTYPCFCSPPRDPTGDRAGVRGAPRTRRPTVPTRAPVGTSPTPNGRTVWPSGRPAALRLRAGGQTVGFVDRFVGRRPPRRRRLRAEPGRRARLVQPRRRGGRRGPERRPGRARRRPGGHHASPDPAATPARPPDTGVRPRSAGARPRRRAARQAPRCGFPHRSGAAGGRAERPARPTGPVDRRREPGSRRRAGRERSGPGRAIRPRPAAARPGPTFDTLVADFTTASMPAGDGD